MGQGQQGHGGQWALPHLNILNTLFLETTGGDLTIKVENNTEVGEGIYSEPVDEE